MPVLALCAAYTSAWLFLPVDTHAEAPEPEHRRRSPTWYNFQVNETKRRPKAPSAQARSWRGGQVVKKWLGGRGRAVIATLLLQDGFKFFFYANEHEPKHVHVAKGDDYAKVELGTFRVAVHPMKAKDLKQALRIIREHASPFEEKRDDWFRNR